MTKLTDSGKVVVNSIGIPGQFVAIASEWYSGSGDMLYAVCSTGGLTTGTNCPVTDYTDDADRMVKWYYSIWLDLASDVGSAYRSACKALNHATERYNDLDDCTDAEIDQRYSDYDACVADAALLADFEEWADNQVSRLESDYPALEDWSGE